MDDPMIETPDGLAKTQASGVVGAFMRFVCQALGLLLIIIGTFFAIQVFTSVYGLVNKPEGMAGAVDQTAELIESEKLSVKIGADRVEAGRLAATMVLFVWYMLCAYIPLAIIAVGGRLVWAMRKPRE
ncbi:hypothetical protein Pan216_14760 [Planctomycetes bacterium Pan216]|uniref:Uncharacterized protein n=1 Tax=Kolteria novifilia TaxID=2527975 RepID=A0A518B0X4_9BACT|nr:hypothetical protein Pan216_14760 [Planctomycetes bacterium Pan216]